MLRHQRRALLRRLDKALAKRNAAQLALLYDEATAAAREKADKAFARWDAEAVRTRITLGSLTDDELRAYAPIRIAEPTTPIDRPEDTDD